MDVKKEHSHDRCTQVIGDLKTCPLWVVGGGQSGSGVLLIFLSFIFFVAVLGRLDYKLG